MAIKQIKQIIIFTFCLLSIGKQIPLLAEKCHIADRHLIDTFVQQMKQEIGLQCVGEGGGWTQDSIETIALKFHAYRMATIGEARALELYVIERFLECINKDVAIQEEFLIEKPATDRNVEISISFEGEYGFGPYFGNSVRYTFNIAQYKQKSTNEIFYRSYDSFNEKYIPLLQESYEEAVQRSQATALKFPYSHQETEVESIINDLLTSYVLSVARDLQLNCWSIGANINPPIEEIGAKFTIFSHTSSQRKAREVFILATQRLLKLINNSKKLAAHLQTPFPSSKLKIRIDFVDYKHCEYMDGSITNVVLDNDQIVYYHRVPIPEKGVKKEWWDKPTVLLAKESYQEAVEAFEKPKNPFPGFLRNFFTQASGETNEFEGSFQIAKIMGAKN